MAVHPAAAVGMTRNDHVPHTEVKPGFWRYITQARRAIFFARYEASQTGSGFIEPEHLLLGILRSDEELALRLFKTKENIESIGRQVRKTFPFRRKISISVDLPLSFECQRMLASRALRKPSVETPVISNPSTCCWDCCGTKNARSPRSCLSMKLCRRCWRIGQDKDNLSGDKSRCPSFAPGTPNCYSD
jgi:hypothetical protein